MQTRSGRPRTQRAALGLDPLRLLHGAAPAQPAHAACSGAGDAAGQAPAGATVPAAAPEPAAPAPARPADPDGPVYVDIGIVCRVGDAAALRQRFLEIVAGGSGVEVGCDEVEIVDGAVIQLLLSLAQTCARRKLPFALRGPSAAMLHAIGRLGLDRALLPGGPG